MAEARRPEKLAIRLERLGDYSFPSKCRFRAHALERICRNEEKTMKSTIRLFLQGILLGTALSVPMFATPTITSVTPSSGTAQTAIRIVGTNLGAVQDGSTVKFNGTAATVISWTTVATGVTTIATTVPPGATSGPVKVTVGGVDSNLVEFIVLYASLPANWVDNTTCNPPGGTYDYTVILDGVSTQNKGPNCHNGTPPACTGTFYTADVLGMEDAFDNWRDNADNQSSASPHFADRWWLVKAPAQSTGTTFHGLTLDSNNALISLPGKLNGTTEPTKCLVVDSTTPLVAYNVSGSVTSGTFSAGERVQQTTSGANATLMNTASLGSFATLQLGPFNGYASQSSFYTWVGQTSGAVFTPTAAPSPYMACGGGLPGFGGARNAGCSSPNDKASMWKAQLDGPRPMASGAVIYAGGDLVTTGNWVNHVVLRDVEITEQPGAAPSARGVNAPYLFRNVSNITNSAPCSLATPCYNPTHVGLDRYYVHGNDPGDAGQPATANVSHVSSTGSGASTVVTYTASNSFFANQRRWPISS
jgi:hypothetical protein